MAVGRRLPQEPLRTVQKHPEIGVRPHHFLLALRHRLPVVRRQVHQVLAGHRNRGPQLLDQRRDASRKLRRPLRLHRDLIGHHAKPPALLAQLCRLDARIHRQDPIGNRDVVNLVHHVRHPHNPLIDLFQSLNRAARLLARLRQPVQQMMQHPLGAADQRGDVRPVLLPRAAPLLAQKLRCPLKVLLRQPRRTIKAVANFLDGGLDQRLCFSNVAAEQCDRTHAASHGIFGGHDTPVGKHFCPQKQHIDGLAKNIRVS